MSYVNSCSFIEPCAPLALNITLYFLAVYTGVIFILSFIEKFAILVVIPLLHPVNVYPILSFATTVICVSYRYFPSAVLFSKSIFSLFVYDKVYFSLKYSYTTSVVPS